MSPISVPRRLEPGLQDGDFRLLRRLGRGGMGEVWVAHQESLDRDVALKFLNGIDSEQTELIERLKIEARSAARIRHVNVVTVHALAVFAARPVVVMEYLEGRSLKELFSSGRRFNLNEILNLAAQVAEGLRAAEAVGVIHRDIKPANLLVLPDDTVKILDFGLARIRTDPSLTRTGTVLGTVQYMSPEQAAGRPADIRSDMYALGVLLFELLSGHLPFRAESPVAIARMHLEDPVPTLSPEQTPPPMEHLVRTLMDKDPDQRPADTAALADLIAETRRQLRGETDLDAHSFHSREVELRMLEDASRALARPRRTWSPSEAGPVSLVAAAVLVLAVLLWPREVPLGKLRLPLDRLPRDTVLVFDEQEISAPFPAYLEIEPGAHQISVAAPLHHRTHIPFTRQKLPDPLDMVPRPHVERISEKLLVLLERAVREPVSVAFLKDIYSTSAMPLELKKLQREIVRVDRARQALEQGESREAVRLIESIPRHERHAPTRRLLQDAQIDLLPDEALRQALQEIQELIRRGESRQADQNIVRLARARPQFLALQKFRQQLDDLEVQRLAVQNALANRDFETMTRAIEDWSEIAPEDSMLEVYRERLNLEKQKLLLEEDRARLLAELEGHERDWNPWVLHAHLAELLELGRRQNLIMPFIQRNRPRLKADLDRRFKALVGPGHDRHGLSGETVDRALADFKGLAEIGWTWTSFRLVTGELSEHGDRLRVTCRLDCAGRLEGGTRPVSLFRNLTIDLKLPESRRDPAADPDISVLSIKGTPP